MGEYEQRKDDVRISEIHADVKELVKSMGDICVKVAVCERANEATQKELTDHKTTHQQNKENGFRVVDIGLVLGELILGIVMWFKK